jgi:CRP/FNR family transcriptional regulator, cyclic AMP receptor protein
MDLVGHFSNARNSIVIPAGQTIFRAGERGTVMYVLLEGSASVLVGGDVVEIAGPGAVLGEMAVVDEAPRSATVLARGDCRLVPVPQAQFDLLIAEAPAFARAVMHALATRLRRMNSRLGSGELPDEDREFPDMAEGCPAL